MFRAFLHYSNRRAALHPFFLNLPIVCSYSTSGSRRATVIDHNHVAPCHASNPAFLVSGVLRDQTPRPSSKILNLSRTLSARHAVAWRWCANQFLHLRPRPGDGLGIFALPPGRRSLTFPNPGFYQVPQAGAGRGAGSVYHFELSAKVPTKLRRTAARQLDLEPVIAALRDIVVQLRVMFSDPRAPQNMTLRTKCT